MVNPLDKLDNLNDFSNFLKDVQPEIGKFGGRQFKKENSTFKLNELVRTFQRLTQNSSTSQDLQKREEITETLNLLDYGADLKNKQAGRLVRMATSIRQLFGNLRFDRQHILQTTRYGGQLVTTKHSFKLMKLKGDDGSVECRVYGQKEACKIPRLSKEGMFIYRNRIRQWLNNMIAVRGVQDKGMVGPINYYGTLEKPHQYQYTIEIKNGMPMYIQHKPGISKANQAAQKSPDSLVKKVQAEWISGPKLQAGQSVVGSSLTANKGILKIHGADSFELKSVRDETIDLKSFKARLVRNDAPFQITEQKTARKDDYRAVSYHYGPQYAEEQMKTGHGGLFLETHSFPQIITPLDKNSVGFVTLGRWDEKKENLELIAVEIPFGYTLIVEEDSIHGDTTLDGTFAMCMTSSHKTMQDVDTVFLKDATDPEFKKNIRLSIEGGGVQKPSSSHAPKAIVTYH
jgi:hypothetical protein